jgi:hypothetical protein
MSQDANKSVINVTFSAETQAAAIGFAALLRDNVDNSSSWHQVNERMVKFGNGTLGSYWVGVASLVVEAKDLNNCLVQVDTVKHGYIPNAEQVFREVFKDVRVEVAAETTVLDLVPILEQNKFMHNKIQELERAVGKLERESLTLSQGCDNHETVIKTLSNRYDEHQAFLHDFIDFKNLIKIVRELAEKVDEEILDVYPLQRVH